MPPVVGPCWASGAAVRKITTMGDSYPDLKSQILITLPVDLNIHMQVQYLKSQLPNNVLREIDYVFSVAMMYSDFPYRPPPPSYQASMQEYRLRLLLLDRNTGSNNPGNPGPSLAEQQSHQQQPVAPPNYRAHLR